MDLEATSIRQNLLAWYKANRRDLPWRRDRNPYGIWISEVMLQQTTVRAVIPYYERFMTRFPTLKSLAKADVKDVLAHWAGLGYYSRARNLHQAAQSLAKLQSFPNNHQDLLTFPGFGPYTARAVASLAYDEPVGVLDGNVIRVLSRIYDLNVMWWKPAERAKLQSLADDLAAAGPSGEINQALMELGSQICTPKTPHCISCPMLQNCHARKSKTVAKRPRQRERKDRQTWLLTMDLVEHNGKLIVRTNDYAPFLRGAMMLPGRVRRVQKAPKAFDFRHSITHHDIYVQIRKRRKLVLKSGERWVLSKEVTRFVQTSLLQKALSRVNR